MKTLTLTIATYALVAAAVVPHALAAGINSPSLAWSPATNGAYDFGQLDAGAGQTKSVTFTATNTGGSPSGALTIVLSGSPALTKTTDTCAGKSLGPSASCSVTLRFAPTTAGESDSATLTAKNLQVSTTITLKGTSGTPNLVLALGTPTGTDTTGGKNYFFAFNANQLVVFQVFNTGTGTSNTLRVIPAVLSAFALVGETCTGQKVAPAGTCFFTLASLPSCGDNGSSALVDIVDFAAATRYITLQARAFSTPCQ